MTKRLALATQSEVEQVIAAATAAFPAWRDTSLTKRTQIALVLPSLPQVTGFAFCGRQQFSDPAAKAGVADSGLLGDLLTEGRDLVLQVPDALTQRRVDGAHRNFGERHQRRHL